MTERTQKSTPFIIWTVQRTGGTNLTKSLVKLSDYRIEQEPFNRRRTYGYITKAWEKDADLNVLQRDIQKVTSGTCNIKHCVENIPWEVSQAILQSPTISNYNHLFLVRENSVPRLLSMEYARRTKVWGPSHQVPEYETDPAFDKPLNVPELLDHESRAIERLNLAWATIVQMGLQPHAVSFEQIYDRSENEAVAHVSAALEALGFTLPPDDVIALTVDLRSQGNQKTRDRYTKFEGVHELEKGLELEHRLQFI